MGAARAGLESLDSIGRRVTSGLEYTANLFVMVYLAIREAVFDQAQGLRAIFSVVSMQIYFTGFQALPLVSVLALASGGIIVMQSNFQLSLLGGAEMVGNLMVVVIVRELGPLMTALIVIARSGTAVASEIGNMRVNREIEALESMGIHPLSYIVFPRLIGGIISVICLAFYYSLVALVGGFLLTRFVHSMSFSFYTDSLANAFASEDLFLFFLKNTFSGMIIFAVSCYQGMSVKGSPHEVPQVTTKAVMDSIVYVVCFNLTVTTAFYVNQLMKMGIL